MKTTPDRDWVCEDPASFAKKRSKEWPRVRKITKWLFDGAIYLDTTYEDVKSYFLTGVLPEEWKLQTRFGNGTRRSQDVLLWRLWLHRDSDVGVLTRILAEYSVGDRYQCGGVFMSCCANTDFSSPDDFPIFGSRGNVMWRLLLVDGLDTDPEDVRARLRDPRLLRWWGTLKDVLVARACEPTVFLTEDLDLAMEETRACSDFEVLSERMFVPLIQCDHYIPPRRLASGEAEHAELVRGVRSALEAPDNPEWMKDVWRRAQTRSEREKLWIDAVLTLDTRHMVPCWHYPPSGTVRRIEPDVLFDATVNVFDRLGFACSKRPPERTRIDVQRLLSDRLRAALNLHEDAPVPAPRLRIWTNDDFMDSTRAAIHVDVVALPPGTTSAKEEVPRSFLLLRPEGAYDLYDAIRWDLNWMLVQRELSASLGTEVLPFGAWRNAGESKRSAIHWGPFHELPYPALRTCAAPLVLGQADEPPVLGGA